jgi:hypothetical protein
MRIRFTQACAASTGARTLDDATLAVDFSGSVPGVTHTQFGAQRVKDDRGPVPGETGAASVDR